MVFTLSEVEGSADALLPVLEVPLDSRFTDYTPEVGDPVVYDRLHKKFKPQTLISRQRPVTSTFKNIPLGSEYIDGGRFASILTEDGYHWVLTVTANTTNASPIRIFTMVGKGPDSPDFVLNSSVSANVGSSQSLNSGGLTRLTKVGTNKYVALYLPLERLSPNDSSLFFRSILLTYNTNKTWTIQVSTTNIVASTGSVSSLYTSALDVASSTDGTSYLVFIAGNPIEAIRFSLDNNTFLSRSFLPNSVSTSIQRPSLDKPSGSDTTYNTVTQVSDGNWVTLNGTEKVYSETSGIFTELPNTTVVNSTGCFSKIDEDVFCQLRNNTNGTLTWFVVRYDSLTKDFIQVQNASYLSPVDTTIDGRDAGAVFIIGNEYIVATSVDGLLVSKINKDDYSLNIAEMWNIVPILNNWFDHSIYDSSSNTMFVTGGRTLGSSTVDCVSFFSGSSIIPLHEPVKVGYVSEVTVDSMSITITAPYKISEKLTPYKEYSNSQLWAATDKILLNTSLAPCIFSRATYPELTSLLSIPFLNAPNKSLSSSTGSLNSFQGHPEGVVGLGFNSKVDTPLSYEYTAYQSTTTSSEVTVLLSITDGFPLAVPFTGTSTSATLPYSTGEAYTRFEYYLCDDSLNTNSTYVGVTGVKY